MPLDPLTIAFALVAIVVIWKLRSVLGETSGFRRDERPGPDKGDTGPSQAAPWTVRRKPPLKPTPDKPAFKLLRLPGATPPAPAVQDATTVPVPPADPERWAKYVEGGSTPAGAPVTGALERIALADPSFAPAPFLDGAKTAYEAIITAFASGERKMLQTLLARDVYDGFAAAIAARDKRGETLSITFVSLDEPKIVAGQLEGRTSRIGVRFLSTQITATKAKDGTLVDGSQDAIVAVNDIWTFARTVNARDPNWKLVATDAGH